ncbi:hypothetical protein GCM10027180_22600 [Microbulbifer echini]
MLRFTLVSTEKFLALCIGALGGEYISYIGLAISSTGIGYQIREIYIYNISQTLSVFLSLFWIQRVENPEPPSKYPLINI